jgi:hypothetical protein
VQGFLSPNATSTISFDENVLVEMNIDTGVSTFAVTVFYELINFIFDLWQKSMTMNLKL